MVTELTEKIKSSLKDAAKKLTGFKKRAFMAQVTIDYFNSSPRRAETELGWSRQAIATGLKELETGIIIVLGGEKKRRNCCQTWRQILRV
jgi:hypothetical protein